MKNVHPSVRQYVWAMRGFGIIFMVVGIAFYFLPNELIYLINVGPKLIKSLETIPETETKFWITLGVSMMMTITFLCFMASFNPKNSGYPIAVLIAKFTSTAGFIYGFAFERLYFGYLVGVLVDGSIFLLILIFFLRARLHVHEGDERRKPDKKNKKPVRTENPEIETAKTESVEQQDPQQKEAPQA